MKNLITSCIAISSIVLAPALKADAPSVVSEEAVAAQEEVSASQGPFHEEPVGLETPSYIAPEATLPSEETADPSVESEGTPVGAGAGEGSNAAKKRQWRNIAIAVVAVAVAITALILVSSNDGHHGHKHKH